MKTNNVVLFLVSKEPLKSILEYPSKLTLFLLKHNVVLEVPFKYSRNPLTTSQCFLPGLDMNLLTSPTT